MVDKVAELKTCACGCGVEFDVRQRRHPGVRYFSDKCQRRAYTRWRYAAGKTKDRDRYRKERNRKWVADERNRRGNMCEVCGTDDIKLLWHHRDPSTRRYMIAGMQQVSLEFLSSELSLCDLICKPCHLKQHYVLSGKKESYQLPLWLHNEKRN